MNNDGKPGNVRHPRFGVGAVVVDNGPTLVVRFSHGIEECAKEDLEHVATLSDKLRANSWDIPIEVIQRIQAEAILSVNNAWGVFSKSLIDLLPHQLWVCRKVNASWPMSWLVADDVGLGKTIEAGMILWPLIARSRVRRLLILCPASLVEQWQFRMRTMFDLRLTAYTTEADTPRADFWATHDLVVASLQRLRKDHGGRMQRMLEAEPWDLLVVDEAHHLNADEQSGSTLGYRFVKRLIDERKITSRVFFTGTPHRGKDFGFLALLNLLQPDVFDPRKPIGPQMRALPEVIIRNNKGNVTDLRGKRLFSPPIVSAETYDYSHEEAEFYDLLTDFIATGEAYASRLESTQGRAVMLVLIAMQKLASSSVAALRRAIKRRIKRIGDGRERLSHLQERLAEYDASESEMSGDDQARLEELLAEETTALALMEDEVPALRRLLQAADAVRAETKINKILDVIEHRYAEQSILFFTEYKATQSSLMSALMKRYGQNSVTFINGDSRAEEVQLPGGEIRTLNEPREEACSRFKAGQTRFLISTEAGGEGIDLQEQCHILIHVDLPWNPMRMHQRVGRLNRYGQTQRVEVVTFRNPDTVESRIWDKLNEKLERINNALAQVMDEPEDLLNLVLGMTSPTIFRNLFSQGSRVPSDSLSSWFDRETSQFGGQDIIKVVQDLVGNTSKFDYRQVSDQLPQVDLPDMQPFFESALASNGRRLKDDSSRMSFITPDSWKTEPLISNEYSNMTFDRRASGTDLHKRLLGVGSKVIDQALRQATGRPASVASLPFDVLHTPLVVFRLRDRVTGSGVGERSIVLGVDVGEEPILRYDWQVLLRMNAIPARRLILQEPSGRPFSQDIVTRTVDAAEALIADRIAKIEHGFRYPVWEILSVLFPADMV